MRKSRFTDEQFVAIRRESDKTPVAEVAKGPDGKALAGRFELMLRT